jgi:hypothetical protein
MKRIEFTEQEEQALLGLLDAACRHAGLQAANAAAVWAAKLQEAQEIADAQAETDELMS